MKIILDCFSSHNEEIKSAASYALGKQHCRLSDATVWSGAWWTHVKWVYIVCFVLFVQVTSALATYPNSFHSYWNRSKLLNDSIYFCILWKRFVLALSRFYTITTNLKNTISIHSQMHSINRRLVHLSAICFLQIISCTSGSKTGLESLRPYVTTIWWVYPTHQGYHWPIYASAKSAATISTIYMLNEVMWLVPVHRVTQVAVDPRVRVSGGGDA